LKKKMMNDNTLLRQLDISLNEMMSLIF